ncbi:ComEA family DNA-binding protein [Vibrio sp. CAU 1672]|uniref:ComEA family DNA-binding protein n=1 Tax=Vibrio sp. CAU 1672 TaxID=3032594 RepID=UPI0023DBE075|nr:ComEA family DNA-binding protein [Vibrio sp. CAU 1672]MDF2153581.1 ComEA family DNA-binding protein [Vibrio sp. CAU 1672]
MKWMLTLWLCLLAPLSLANDTQPNDKYKGIEITVNINTAPAEEIADLLKGIGLKKAQDIVDYREQHGPFKTTAELSNVKGIGPATIEKNQGRIVL